MSLPRTHYYKSIAITKEGALVSLLSFKRVYYELGNTTQLTDGTPIFTYQYYDIAYNESCLGNLTFLKKNIVGYAVLVGTGLPYEGDHYSMLSHTLHSEDFIVNFWRTADKREKNTEYFANAISLPYGTSLLSSFTPLGFVDPLSMKTVSQAEITDYLISKKYVDTYLNQLRK